MAVDPSARGIAGAAYRWPSQGISGAFPRNTNERGRDIPSIFDWISDTSHATIEGGSNLNDFSSNIQAAIDWGATQPFGSAILVNRGSFHVGTSLVLDSGVSLYYPSQTNNSSLNGHPRLLATSGMTAPLITDNGASVSNSSVSGIYFLGSGNTIAQTAISLTLANNCVFENSLFEQFGTSAIIIPAGTTCKLRNLLTVNSGSLPKSAIGGVIDIGGSEHWIRDCEIGSNVGGINTGTSVSGTGYNNVAVHCQGADCWFENVYGEFAEVGFYVDTIGNNRFVNCVSDNCTGQGVYVTSAQNWFANHLVHACGKNANNSVDGFYVVGWQNRFQGCVVTTSTAANKVRYGFNDSSPGNYGTGMNLYDDQCWAYEFGTSAYNQSNPGTGRASFRTPFRGTQFAIVGSNQSINVEGHEAISISAASAASLSSFTGGQNNQSVRMSFADANTTFVNGTNFATPGGTGFTGSAATIWDAFTPNGTKWYFKQFA